MKHLKYAEQKNASTSLLCLQKGLSAHCFKPVSINFEMLSCVGNLVSCSSIFRMQTDKNEETLLSKVIEYFISILYFEIEIFCSLQEMDGVHVQSLQH